MASMSFESQAFFKIVKTLKNDHYLSGNERMNLGNFFISKYFHLKENEDIDLKPKPQKP